MTRETLHRLVDDLDEGDLPTAARVLTALRETGAEAGPFYSLDTAPPDDEPETPEERAAVEEALREIGSGSGIPHEEVKRRWGLP